MSDFASWRQRLAKANDPAFWPIEAIEQMLAEGRAQFWANDRAAAVSTVNTYPGGAVAFEVIAACGDRREIIGTLYPASRAWAESVGCTHFKITGRRGWAREMKPHGFRHFQDIVIRELPDG